MEMEINKIASKAQILWQCRRGMLELDMALLSFVNGCYDSLTSEVKRVFIQLLNQSDQELYDWLLGKSLPENPDFLPILKMMRERAWIGG